MIAITTQTTAQTARRAALSASALRAVTGGTYTDRNGTAGHDAIFGNAGQDKVFGYAGNDVITTLGGDDEVHAGAGNDVVAAGDGNDKVFGESWGDAYGNDTLNGGNGSDELHGDAPGQQQQGGHDMLDGGAGDRAADKAFGGGGDDTYTWRQGDGNDEFHGDAGNDTLRFQHLTAHQIQSALQSYVGQVRLVFDAHGVGSFLDSQNRPVSFSGEFRIGGETLKVFNLERVTLA